MSHVPTTQKITSRTRHYHVRWHFFWQDVCDRMIDVIYVETKEQQADYIIKGIPAQVFVHLHLKVWPYKVGYSCARSESRSHQEKAKMNP